MSLSDWVFMLVIGCAFLLCWRILWLQAEVERLRNKISERDLSEEAYGDASLLGKNI